MIKTLEKTGKTEDLALAAALSELGMDRDDVSVEILERARTGFLGFGASPAKIRVSYEVADEPKPKAAPQRSLKPETETHARPQEKNAEPQAEAARKSEKKQAAPPEKKPEKTQEKTQEKKSEKRSEKNPEKKPRKPEKTERKQEKKADTSASAAAKSSASVPVEQKEETPMTPEEAAAEEMAIRNFLTGLFERMGIDAEIAISRRDNNGIDVRLSGDSMGAVIGRRGETLDAIQHLTNYVVNRGSDKRMHISIDAEAYRAKREESLVHLAEKMAEKALKYRRSMALEPMNSYERHVIHTALQDYEGVTTASTGEEPNRRVVVTPVKTENEPAPRPKSRTREWA